MADNKKAVTISLPFGGIIPIVLIVLKALGHIGMSWFWVISSFIWIPLGIIVLVFAILFIVAIIAAACGG
jgi:hypothetical protein